MAACDGIGSSRRGDFPTYPGVSDSSSGTSSGSNSYGIFGSGMSGGDLFTLANSGDIAAITEALSETTTISFSSSAIGLSAGGSVTLMISGNGIAYTAEASDAGDGFVYFTIPKIANGTVITVSIIVRNQDGSVACAGSETQTVTNDAHDIHVSLIGDSDGPWTLPASIPVSASPVSITFNNASPQDVTFSVAGLTPPPSGTLTYSWTKSDGTPLPGPGSSVTVSLTDLLPPGPSAGPAGCSVTVTATYTDADGNSSTSSGTGVVSVTVLEIPAFTVTVEPPAGVGLHTGTTDEYDVADRTQQFTFTATPAAGTAFPDDAVFAWTINGIPQSGTTASIQASPDDFNCSSLIATSAMGNVIICEVSSAKAVNSPVTDSTKTLKLWKAPLPKPVIDVPTTSNGTYIGAEGTTYSFYAVSGVSANTNFSFSTSTTMPAGTTFNWKVDGESKTGDSGTASLSNWALGSLKTGLDAPCTFSVTCTAICPGYDNIESDPITVKVLTYPSSVPEFHVSIDSMPGQVYGTGSQCYDVVYDSIIGVKLYENGVSTGGLPPNGAASFAWTANGAAVKTTTIQQTTLKVGEVLAALGTSVSALPNYDSTMLSAPSGGLEVEIQCTITVTLSGATRASDTSSSYETSRKVTLYQ